MHAQPVTTVDKWCPPLRLFDKGTKEMRLWVVDHLNAALGHDAAVVCLPISRSQRVQINSIGPQHTPITLLASFSALEEAMAGRGAITQKGGKEKDHDNDKEQARR
jgi:hypothetical protein